MIVNSEKHALAQGLVKSGEWVVDPEAGVIIGKRGRPIGSLNDKGRIKVTMHIGNKDFSLQACRVIWEAVYGSIPNDLEINHINGDPTDNRISNMELVTCGENHAHAYRLGLKKPSMRPGHPNVRLTPEIAQEIRAQRELGLSQRQVARAFNVSPTTVCDVSTGRRWQ